MLFFLLSREKKLLESIRYVDLVIPATSWDQKINDINEFKVDILVIGDDWKGKFHF